MKAMILAAGLGTRLRPLTYKTPKPLLPVKGKPLIEYALARLKKAGIKDVVINLHHLGGQIKKHIGNGQKFGLNVRYSYERKILGTGGGIKKAEKLLKNGAFLVMNSDTLIDVDLKKLISFHKKTGGAATMVIRKLKRGEAFAKLNITKNGRLKNFGSGGFMFCGVQVLEPVIFKFLKKPSCLIKDGYKKLLAKNLPVHTYLYKGYFNDVGTLERLKFANKR